MKPTTIRTVCFCFCVLFAFARGGFASEAIVVENYADGDVVRFPVALLRGKVESSESDGSAVVVENLSSSRKTRVMRTKTFDSRFKALVELTPGENLLSISVGASRLELTLIYRKSRNPYFVRLVYFVDSSEDASFESPTEAGGFSADYCDKMRTCALLWQTATAERLRDFGYGRRSFTLEFDKNEDVVVWLQRGKRKATEYRAMSETERFKAIYREILAGDAYSERAKYFVLVAFARRNSKDDEIEGRVALGGGVVAMLDSSLFFEWFDSLDEVEECFNDSAPIDERYLRDAAYRNARWALASSAVGAGLHELGHAFGLGHSDDPNDFMSRGFDRFNRIFSVYEPPTASSIGGKVDENETPRWNKKSAEKLVLSRWIDE